MQQSLTTLLGIQYPVIMAPMFLVSNTKMVKAALDGGITGAIPDLGVDYVITSLGSPKEAIEEGRKQGMKVFCDVTDVHYAQKVVDLGADALIGVNKEAGGHAGNIAGHELIPLLKSKFSVPIISAGGVATGKQLKERLELGANGASIGTVFIATKECEVSHEYKQACVDYGAKDIVMTTKISGSPCTVINTPYVQEIGTEPSFLERLMHKNKKLKKYIKLLIAYRGMKSIEKAAFQATYKTVWCAGPTIEDVHRIRPVKEVIEELVSEL